MEPHFWGKGKMERSKLTPLSRDVLKWLDDLKVSGDLARIPDVVPLMVAQFEIEKTVATSLLRLWSWHR